jgi:hypothetical protein
MMGMMRPGRLRIKLMATCAGDLPICRAIMGCLVGDGQFQLIDGLERGR